MLRKFDLRLQALIGIIVASTIVLATLSWSYFFYLRLYDTIVDSYDDKLYVISGITGSFIDGDAHASLVESRDEASAAYAALTKPMREILKKMELTYVYSQILLDDPECMYVLDATEGEDHTEIGYVDELPPEDYAGAQKVLNGGIHIGKVQDTDHWGMIKVSYAPIYDSEGRILAMAGADVNLDMIKMKTRIALLAAFGLGVVGISLGLLASIVVARRLTEPLNVLKQGALRLASGSYSHRIEVQQPHELALLASSFNQMSGNLVETLESQKDEREKTQASRERLDRKEWLASQMPLPLQQGAISSAVSLCLLNDGEPQMTSATSSSWIANDREVVAWMVPAEGDALKSLERRCAIGESIRRILANRDGETDSEIAEILKSECSSFLSYRASERSVRIHPFKPATVWHWKGENGFVEENIVQPQQLKIAEDGCILFTDATEPLSDAFLERCAAILSGSFSTEERKQGLEELLSQVAVQQQTLFGAIYCPVDELLSLPS